MTQKSTSLLCSRPLCVRVPFVFHDRKQAEAMERIESYNDAF
jgi:hypothetical protein